MSQEKIPFVHLKAHTEYSVQDGILRVKDYVKQGEHFGQVALGISDVMNIFALIKFYKVARSKGVKPILGCDVWIENSENLKDPSLLTLYVKNHQGYLNLCTLLTKAWTENQYIDTAFIKKEWLKTYHEGLIVLSGARLGEIGQLVLKDKLSKAEEIAKEWQSIFGDDFFIELQRAGFSEENTYIHNVLPLASNLGIPIVATHPIEFLEEQDYKAQNIRVCIAKGEYLSDSKSHLRTTKQQYMLSTEEMVNLFSDLPVALENSVNIAIKCNLQLQLGQPQLPLFPTPPGVSLDQHLINLAKSGLEKRLDFLYPDHKETHRKPYDERLERECNTIINMGFSGYFLIVQEFINWGEKQWGTGRSRKRIRCRLFGRIFLRYYRS